METTQPNNETEAETPKAELEELEAPEREMTEDEAGKVEGGTVRLLTSVQYPYK